MIQNMMDKYDCDAMLFLDLKNVRYFSGFRGDTGLLIYTKKEMVLVVDPRFELEAKNTVKKARKVIYRGETSIWDVPWLYEELKIKKMGFFPSSMTVDVYNKLKGTVQLVAMDMPSSVYRCVKTKKEIALIKKSVEIQEKAYKGVFPKLSEGISEAIYAAELDHLMRLNGADGLAFPSIVAFGDNSAVIHAIPTNRKIKGDGALMIDFGATYEGYCSDQTVTLLFGKIDKKLLKIYDDVYTAQKRAIEAVRPGVSAKELYEKGFGYLIKKGYGKLIQHSLGHSLGLEIHEPPKIAPYTDFIFEEGMVFTIEPGLYLPSVGGVRLEDMILVTSKGFEVLTSLPKEKKFII